MKKTRKKGKKPTKEKKPIKKKKKVKLWGLERLTFNKAAQQYLDQDYISTLDDKDKEWLSRFNNEYYGNTLNKNWNKNLHYKEQKKAIFDQTNARNRDIFNKRYKFNEHESGIAIPDSYHEHTNPEGAYADYIDIQRKVLSFMNEARESGLEEAEIIEITKKVFDLD